MIGVPGKQYLRPASYFRSPSNASTLSDAELVVQDCRAFAVALEARGRLQHLIQILLFRRRRYAHFRVERAFS